MINKRIFACKFLFCKNCDEYQLNYHKNIWKLHYTKIWWQLIRYRSNCYRDHFGKFEICFRIFFLHWASQCLTDNLTFFCIDPIDHDRNREQFALPHTVILLYTGYYPTVSFSRGILIKLGQLSSDRVIIQFLFAGTRIYPRFNYISLFDY